MPLPALSDLKSQVRIADESEDTLLAKYLASAISFIEEYVSRSYRGGERGAYSARFPRNKRPLRLKNIEATEAAISYYPEDGGALALLESANYRFIVRGRGRRPEIVPNDDWPQTFKDLPEPVSITETLTATEPPEAINEAILLLAAHFFENRIEAMAPGSAVPMAVASLCAPFRSYAP